MLYIDYALETGKITFLVIGGEIGAGCNTDIFWLWVNEHPNLQRLFHRYAYLSRNETVHREVLLFKIVYAKQANDDAPLDSRDRVDILRIED